MGADSQKLTKPVTEKPATSRLFNASQTLSGLSQVRRPISSTQTNSGQKKTTLTYPGICDCR
jgi:hypothetical protein